MSLLEVMQDLSTQVGRLKFGKPVEFVYNPLDYAWEGHKAYLEAFFMEKEAKQKDGTKVGTDDTRFVVGSREVVLVSMNPGPYGMTQTGKTAANRDIVHQQCQQHHCRNPLWSATYSEGVDAHCVSAARDCNPCTRQALPQPTHHWILFFCFYERRSEREEGLWLGQTYLWHCREFFQQDVPLHLLPSAVHGEEWHQPNSR